MYRTYGNADSSNRMLATVLFTDIVDPTSKAAELGDARWRTPSRTGPASYPRTPANAS